MEAINGECAAILTCNGSARLAPAAPRAERAVAEGPRDDLRAFAGGRAAGRRARDRGRGVAAEVLSQEIAGHPIGVFAQDLMVNVLGQFKLEIGWGKTGFPSDAIFNFGLAGRF